MKTLHLYNSEKVALVDDDDYRELSRHNWYLHPRGYAICYQHTARPRNKRNIFLHNYLMKPGPGLQVDHKNRNKLDCRRDNLRLCTQSENHGNKPKPAGKHTSKHKGVSFDAATGKWFSLICCRGKNHFCGRYSNETDAALAYDTKARELFGEFALTNFPVGGDSNNG